MSKCEHGLTSRECYVCASPKHGEQPEQEPVALFTKYGPPTMRDRDFWSAGYAAATARAIEAALAQQEQEPVVLHRELIEIHSDGTETWKETPLYTAPPRREWQSLSEEEIGAIDKSLPRGMLLAAGKKEFARAIEAKLKEKNNG